MFEGFSIYFAAGNMGPSSRQLRSHPSWLQPFRESGKPCATETNAQRPPY